MGNLQNIPHQMTSLYESKCTVSIFGHSPRSEFPRHLWRFPAVTNSKKHHIIISITIYTRESHRAPQTPASQHPGLITRVISLSSRIRTARRGESNTKARFLIWRGRPLIIHARREKNITSSHQTENKAEECERKGLSQ